MLDQKPEVKGFSFFFFFNILDNILCCRSFKILMQTSLSIFSFVSYALCVINNNPLPNSRSLIFMSLFSSKSFMVLLLKFRLSIRFESIFV